MEHWFDEEEWVPQTANGRTQIDGPTTVDLSHLVQNLAPRVDSLNTALAAQRSDLKSKIDSSRTIGVIGLIVGALGLAAAATALARRRRS